MASPANWLPTYCRILQDRIREVTDYKQNAPGDHDDDLGALAHRVESSPVDDAPQNRRRWIRRFVWLGLAASLALTVASAASFQTALVYIGMEHHVLFIGGGLLVKDSPAPVHGGFQWADAKIPPKPLIQRLRGWFMLPQGMGSGSVFIPFGIPVAILAAGSLFILRKSRLSIPSGHCALCGYDLTGNTSGRCSECGAEVTE